MESGVFEPANRSTTRFDDSSLKTYRLAVAPEIEESKALAKVDLCDDDDNYRNKGSVLDNKENDGPP